MLNLDTFLPAFLFITRFAESYSEGTYGSDAYNEAGSATPNQPPTSPTQPATKANDTPVVNGDQPASSTDDTPRTTTSQPSTRQNDTAQETADVTGADPMTIILISVIALVILITAIILIIKRTARRQ